MLWLSVGDQLRLRHNSAEHDQAGRDEIQPGVDVDFSASDSSSVDARSRADEASEIQDQFKYA